MQACRKAPLDVTVLSCESAETGERTSADGGTHPAAEVVGNIRGEQEDEETAESRHGDKYSQSTSGRAVEV